MNEHLHQGIKALISRSGFLLPKFNIKCIKNCLAIYVATWKVTPYVTAKNSCLNTTECTLHKGKDCVPYSMLFLEPRIAPEMNV